MGNDFPSGRRYLHHQFIHSHWSLSVHSITNSFGLPDGSSLVEICQNKRTYIAQLSKRKLKYLDTIRTKLAETASNARSYTYANATPKFLHNLVLRVTDWLQAGDIRSQRVIVNCHSRSFTLCMLIAYAIVATYIDLKQSFRKCNPRSPSVTLTRIA